MRFFCRWSAGHQINPEGIQQRFGDIGANAGNAILLVELEVRRFMRATRQQLAIDPHTQPFVAVPGHHRGRFTARQITDVAIPDMSLEQDVGERLRHFGHLVATIGPVNRRLVF